jgi:hypothetical protein
VRLAARTLHDLSVVINEIDLAGEVQMNGDDKKFIFTPFPQPPFQTAVTSHLPPIAAREREHNWTRGGPYHYKITWSRRVERYHHTEEVRFVELLMQRDELRCMRHCRGRLHRPRARQYLPREYSRLQAPIQCRSRNTKNR